MPAKEGDIVPWTVNVIAVANANLPTFGLVVTENTYETPLTEPLGSNFFRCKAQRGEMAGRGSNVINLSIFRR